ncbi:MAG: radical SAM family heme chaperone HemW [Bacteroidota bacterium]
MSNEVGVYLHLPFCLSKCRYCSFPSEGGKLFLIEPYLEALRQELDFYRPDQPTARTWYLGGGTPSLLSPHQLESLLADVETHLPFQAGAERTIEVNPATGSDELWRVARAYGVNRASIGAQSFSERLLRRIGRLHDPEAIRRTVHALREAGIENVSLDLIYGLPDQTLEDWKETLEEALRLEPAHLSVYGLSVEEGTPFCLEQEQGILRLPEEATEVRMAEIAEETLSAAGFLHYEIASWAREGFESRHNCIYWKLEPYLGLGAGAHSYYRHRRYAHGPSIEGYIREPLPRFPDAALTKEEEMQEFLFLGLRLLREGVSEEEFQARFGVSLDEVFGAAIADLLSKGLLLREGLRIRLAPQALLIANEVFLAFV